MPLQGGLVRDNKVYCSANYKFIVFFKLADIAYQLGKNAVLEAFDKCKVITHSLQDRIPFSIPLSH